MSTDDSVTHSLSEEGRVAFSKLVVDFCQDLSRTFPEYQDGWSKWLADEVPQEEWDALLGYMVHVFPERFFDILYQNNDIFAEGSEVNVAFLPGVNFRQLFQLNISETTHQTLWKYLQLLLFQVMEEVKTKASLGQTADMFEGIKEEELQSKLEETFRGLQEFFAKRALEGDGSSSSSSSSPSGFQPPEGFQPEKLQEHLRRLMDGKIGGLVKELMEELKDDMETMQQELSDKYGVSPEQMDASTVPMQDIMKELMGNPGKVSSIMKKVSNKLKTTMTAENRQEYVSETMDLLNQMGGQEEMMKMFEQMKNMMGGGGGAGGAGAGAGATGGLGGLGQLLGQMGKNVKVDQNAMDRMQKQQATRQKMRENLEAKKLLVKQPDGSEVFRVEGETQEKTPAALKNEELEALMQQFGLKEDEPKKKTGKKKTKK